MKVSLLLEQQLLSKVKAATKKLQNLSPTLPPFESAQKLRKGPDDPVRDDGGSGGESFADVVVPTHAMAALGSRPEETWMVGDHLIWEVSAPQQLGIHAI